MGIGSLFGYGQWDKASLQDLKSPVPLEDGLKQQRGEFQDCTSCRLMGSAVFAGMGVYTYASGMKQLRQQEMTILKSGSLYGITARKYSIFGLSTTLVGMGIYRLYN
ncbi:hypothetical protein K431DRAFT_230165 [Polychaeton citri CBS 116435]|uniref:Distal membrane-arm assembly complex protein 1-like domain-containing protein n=1 Tax=Polychaeton citri CBS 116435 TaxID=1314669 RepID=A0A9P4UMV8_9PEZI|nr:hypothetical protein K431DRAFT_230165 [Polychaeton citri CBS 116435]